MEFCSCKDYIEEEAVKELKPVLESTGIPKVYSDAVATGLSTGNWQQPIQGLATSQFMNPLAQQITQGNPFMQGAFPNAFGNFQNPQQFVQNEVVDGIKKKGLKTNFGSRLD